MARLPRLAVAGLAHCVALRGHSGRPIAEDDHDRQAAIDMLREAAGVTGVAVHGYALLTESLWLLVTPPEGPALGRTLQSFGRRYVSAFNRRHGARGTLWEGRYRATVVDDERVLGALRHLDLAAVHAGLAATAADWPWSSAMAHLGVRRDPLLAPHARYWGLGNTPFEREAAYRAWLAEGESQDDARALESATLHGWAYGSAAFVSALQAATARPLLPRAPGRPRGKKTVPV
ncbi:transposase [Aquabacterium sp. J223]|uniref:transposase n=1 Tax=Aquabacterium sp. J223 TaxID=2898431 RepID=UPI0021ADF350|nr:transposase [Aquabacterium sp. J223]UUX96541.1 transposase [Aquabacterium sp. J223]